MNKYIKFHFEPSIEPGEIVIIPIGKLELIYDRSLYSKTLDAEMSGAVDLSQGYLAEIEFKISKDTTKSSR